MKRKFRCRGCGQMHFVGSKIAQEHLSGKSSRLMFMDYGIGYYGDNANKRKYLYKSYGQRPSEAFPEIRGSNISKKRFNKIYLKYKKQGRAGIGYRRFYGEGMRV